MCLELPILKCLQKNQSNKRDSTIKYVFKFSEGSARLLIVWFHQISLKTQKKQRRSSLSCNFFFTGDLKSINITKQIEVKTHTEASYVFGQ